VKAKVKKHYILVSIDPTYPYELKEKLMSLNHPIALKIQLIAAKNTVLLLAHNFPRFIL